MSATTNATPTRNSAQRMLAEILSVEVAERQPTARPPEASVDKLAELQLELECLLFDSTSSRREIRSKAKDIIAVAARFLLDFEED